MEEEKQRAIADPRQAGTEAAIEALLAGFLADFLFDLLPLDAEGRIGERVVEVLPVQASAERVLPKMMLAMSCPLMSMSALQMA